MQPHHGLNVWPVHSIVELRAIQLPPPTIRIAQGSGRPSLVVLSGFRRRHRPRLRTAVVYGPADRSWHGGGTLRPSSRGRVAQQARGRSSQTEAVRGAPRLRGAARQGQRPCGPAPRTGRPEPPWPLGPATEEARAVRAAVRRKRGRHGTPAVPGARKAHRTTPQPEACSTAERPPAAAAPSADAPQVDQPGRRAGRPRITAPASSTTCLRSSSTWPPRPTATSLAQQAELLDSTVDRGALAALAAPVTTGTRRVPGIKLHDDRLIRLLDNLLYTGGLLGDWTTRQLHERILARHRLGEDDYTLGQLRYDLSKLRPWLGGAGRSQSALSTHPGRRAARRVARQDPHPSARPHLRRPDPGSKAS